MLRISDFYLNIIFTGYILKYFKKIILIFLIISFPVILLADFKVGYYSLKSDKEKSFFNGIKKSLPNSEFIKINGKKDTDVDIIFAFNYRDYTKASKLQKKIFYACFDKKFSEKLINNNLIGAFCPSLPYYQIIMSIKNKFKDIGSIGIVLHNESTIKDIAKLRIYNPLIRLYEVSEKSRVLFKFKTAIDENDFILLLPDDFVFDYFSFQKILKQLINNDKLFAGYSKAFMKLGAAMAFEADYFKEGIKIGEFLKNIKKSKVRKFKRFYLENIKLYFKDE